MATARQNRPRPGYRAARHRRFRFSPCDFERTTEQGAGSIEREQGTGSSGVAPLRGHGHCFRGSPPPVGGDNAHCSLLPASFPVPCPLFPVPCSLFPVPCSLLDVYVLWREE